MADVQLEHGHIRIANLLYDAILDADFTDTQRRIVLAIVRLTYGWRQKTVTISLAELAEKMRVDVSGGFRRSLHDLVEHGVLKRVAMGGPGISTTYMLQKDFTRWGRFSVAPARLEALWGDRPASADVHVDVCPPEDIPLGGYDPVGSEVMPPQGHKLCPDRVTSTGDNSQQESELQARKDRTDRKDSTTTTADARADANVVIVAAANRGITERYGEQPLPLRHDAGSTHEAVREILAAGVPLDFARDAVYTRAKACTLKRPPRSVGYFTEAVLDMWRNEQARAAAAELPTPNEIPPPVRAPEGAYRAPPHRGRTVAQRTLENGLRAFGMDPSTLRQS